ncbi:hypothetical protein [Brevibacillus fulvus]|uniref:Uncharacterized protein n=1 Tax=Brevibacillus fulvus TaxID=1125967 RepID=A0A938XWL1_9BACL|nr:hypothetical protein [Brevibacillus fulvus]MBM7591833.1 hypothetical protein [Brevibacillus fulvus]
MKDQTENQTTANKNEELTELGTHFSAIPDLHKTRETAKTHKIEPPDEDNAGSMASY